MTKIAISPNVSGTGTFTIAAPDSNTDRTLTLPDAAGTVFLSDASNTIQPSNISDGTTTVGTEYVVNGSAKHWANFYGGGATAALRQTFNVASLTDGGVGVYSLFFTNNYSAIGWVAISAGEWDNSNGLGGSGTSSTSSVTLVSGSFSPLAVQDDPNYQSAGFGDLA